MFVERQSRGRTISSLQEQYQSRLLNPFYRTLARHFEAYPHTRPRAPEQRTLTCQFIEGTPTKADLRKWGGSAFMCGETALEGKPYCEAHCRRAYVQPSRYRCEKCGLSRNTPTQAIEEDSRFYFAFVSHIAVQDAPKMCLDCRNAMLSEMLSERKTR